MRSLILSILAVSLLAAPLAVAQPAPCTFTWSQDETGRLWLHHAMDANCGIADFEYVVTFDAGVIHVLENGLLPMGFATCMCNYDTDVVISNLDPGDWLVDWTMCHVDLSSGIAVPYCDDPCAFTVTIPEGPALPSDPYFVGFEASGCGLYIAAVPDGAKDDLATWGTLKSLYR